MENTKIFEEVWTGEREYTPNGKNTAKKLKELGIESPIGKMVQIDKKTWKIK